MSKLTKLERQAAQEAAQRWPAGRSGYYIYGGGIPSCLDALSAVERVKCYSNALNHC